MPSTHCTDDHGEDQNEDANDGTSENEYEPNQKEQHAKESSGTYRFAFLDWHQRNLASATRSELSLTWDPDSISRKIGFAETAGDSGFQDLLGAEGARFLGPVIGGKGSGLI